MSEHMAAAVPGGVGPRFRHVVLTRFNVRWDESATGPSIGTNRDWLSRRFDLFGRYCLPTILEQSRQDFSWILFFDHETPPDFAERARGLARLHPGVVAEFCPPLTNDLVRAAIEKALPDPPEWLLTTRLDNDDGLHRDFVAAVQDAQRFQGAEVLNCPLGIVLQGARTYRQRHLSNAFISLSEPFAERRTVLGIARHVYASESYPVRQVGTGPLWLQVIHGGNVSNRVRGRRVPFAAVSGFSPLAALAPEARDRPGEILVENLTADLIRSTRDLAVASARRAARLFGVELRRRAAKPTLSASS